MKKTNLKKASILLAVALTPFVLAGCATDAERDPALDTLASCITESGLKMYGTERCGHCKEQKKKFGESFDMIDYIDCEQQKNECLMAGVEWYPTWIAKDQSKLVWWQELAALAEKAGCEYSEV